MSSTRSSAIQASSSGCGKKTRFGPHCGEQSYRERGPGAKAPSRRSRRRRSRRIGHAEGRAQSVSSSSTHRAPAQSDDGPPVDEQRDAVGEARGEREVVDDRGDGDPARGLLAGELEQRDRVPQIEERGGLVEEQHARRTGPAPGRRARAFAPRRTGDRTDDRPARRGRYASIALSTAAPSSRRSRSQAS